MSNIGNIMVNTVRYTYSCRNNSFRLFSTSVVSCKKQASVIPKNILEEHITAHKQAQLGKVYDKKPFKMVLKPNKQYAWCCCGWSKTQPLCDGTHKIPYLKLTLKPVWFQVEEEKEYYICNCKQTSHRPFCDGTHKREDIQEEIKT